MWLRITVIGVLNFVTAALSIPIFATAIWLVSTHSSDCMRLPLWPIIVASVYIFLVSIAGLLGDCYRVPWLLWVNAVLMFLIIFLLFCLTVYSSVASNKDGARLFLQKGPMSLSW
ncbi:hypothetical protein KP509_1Z036800 [Ceratopteris richardii]|nr:hypothetical protein KP509_1Z036800 [Ceratopteris richardii]